MKPVLHFDCRDATGLPSNGLEYEGNLCPSSAQQKAQHYDLQNVVDADLCRLIDLWATFSEDARIQILDYADQLTVNRVNHLTD
jgi:hypothetical protein